MNGRVRLTRGIGLSLVLAAGWLLLPSVPASAQAPVGTDQVAAVTAPSPASCKLDLAALQGGSCAAPALDQNEPESWVETAVTDAGGRKGYCHCGCVNVRVCHTSADCGGASCDKFISCC